MFKVLVIVKPTHWIPTIPVAGKILSNKHGKFFGCGSGLENNWRFVNLWQLPPADVSDSTSLNLELVNISWGCCVAKIIHDKCSYIEMRFAQLIEFYVFHLCFIDLVFEILVMCSHTSALCFDYCNSISSVKILSSFNGYWSCLVFIIGSMPKKVTYTITDFH